MIGTNMLFRRTWIHDLMKYLLWKTIFVTESASNGNLEDWATFESSPRPSLLICFVSRILCEPLPSSLEHAIILALHAYIILFK